MRMAPSAAELAENMMREKWISSDSTKAVVMPGFGSVGAPVRFNGDIDDVEMVVSISCIDVSGIHDS